MSGLWIGYGGGNHRYGSIHAFDLKVLTAFWGIFIFLFSVRTRVAPECGNPSYFKSVGSMNSGQRWGNDAHAEARRTRRKKSCRILTERLSPEVCLMMFTKGTSRNISAPSATPGEAIPAMSLNESIVEGGALEWFGEQCRGALNLTPTLS